MKVSLPYDYGSSAFVCLVPEAAIPVTAVEQHLSTRCRPAVGQPLAASPAICPTLAFGPSWPSLC